MQSLYQPPWREGEGPIPQLLIQPALRFMRTEVSGGIVIVLGAIAALIWANVDAHSYHAFWDTEITLDLDILTLREDLHGWVNDLLMTVFFFVVGMEVKRELTVGELSDRRAAALPVFAALGGMIVPALIFTAFNAGGEGSKGWGIPVATDIAFALGVLALVGRRIPVQLKIFLLALAVADDVGGILIIAVFYTADLDLVWLGAALGFVVLILVMQRAGVRAIPAYWVAGGLLWLATFESGVEATIAGVALGLLTPVRPLYASDPGLARALGRRAADLDLAAALPVARDRDAATALALEEAEELSREARSPLERLEHAISPWSAFLIVPIFALANAGIELSGEALEAAAKSEIAWGVALGLIVGKFVGIFSFSWLAVRSGIAIKPAVFTWAQMAGVAVLGGVGFTVAIFITTLAFDDPVLVEDAKIAILAASLVAAAIGFTILRLLPAPRPAAPDPASASGSSPPTSGPRASHG